MKQEVEKLVYMIKLLNNEFPTQEWEKLQNDNACRTAIAQNLQSIYRIIDCNACIDPVLLIKCLQYNNKDSRVVGKIASICNGMDNKIHTSELAKVLTKQDLDELLIALIKSGFKEYAKYLINLNVK
jgi:hypothetical protein